MSWAKLYSGISFLSNWMGWKKEDRFYTVSLRIFEAIKCSSDIEYSVCLSITGPPQFLDLHLVLVLDQPS